MQEVKACRLGYAVTGGNVVVEMAVGNKSNVNHCGQKCLDLEVNMEKEHARIETFDLTVVTSAHRQTFLLFSQNLVAEGETNNLLIR